jgi:sugar-specific transcriptional regulator TrmB
MNLTEHLRGLGFTELEAKCILSLSEKGRMTGYEVAKDIGASRSNVYSTLATLTEKGAILLIEGSPAVYQPLPVKDFVNTIRNGVGQSLNFLSEHLPRPSADQYVFASIEGRKAVLDRVNAEIAGAKKEVLGDVWSEDYELFADSLEKADKRKHTQVLLMVLGKVETELKGVLFDEREESWQSQGWRKFAFVVDQRLAVLGVSGKNYATRALVSEHPALVWMLLNSMFQDLVLHEITEDFGPQISKKYGRNFEKILKKYTGRDWQNFRP